jgi:hypothetical protein
MSNFNKDSMQVITFNSDTEPYDAVKQAYQWLRDKSASCPNLWVHSGTLGYEGGEVDEFYFTILYREPVPVPVPVPEPMLEPTEGIDRVVNRLGMHTLENIIQRERQNLRMPNRDSRYEGLGFDRGEVVTKGKYERSQRKGASQVQRHMLNIMYTDNGLTLHNLRIRLGFEDTWSNKVSMMRSMHRLKKRGLVAVKGKNAQKENLWVKVGE